MAQLFSPQLKKNWKNTKISLQTKIRILEAKVINLVEWSSETRVLRMVEEDSVIFLIVKGYF